MQFFVLVPIKIDFELVQKLVNQIRKVCQEIEKVCVKSLIVVSVVTVSCQLNVEWKLVVVAHKPQENQDETKQTADVRESVVDFSERSRYLQGDGRFS